MKEIQNHDIKIRWKQAKPLKKKGSTLKLSSDKTGGRTRKFKKSSEAKDENLQKNKRTTILKAVQGKRTRSKPKFSVKKL